MIRVKEKRGLVGILNYADSIFSQCLFCSILQYFLLQKIDMLGTSQIVNIIKELWTEFDEPIAFLCKGEHWITPRGNVKSYQSYRKGMLFLFPFYFLFYHFILFHGSGIQLITRYHKRQKIRCRYTGVFHYQLYNGINSISLLASRVSLMEFNFSPPLLSPLLPSFSPPSPFLPVPN